MTTQTKEQLLSKAGPVAYETIRRFGDSYSALVDTIVLLWQEQDKVKQLQNVLMDIIYKAEGLDESEDFDPGQILYEIGEICSKARRGIYVSPQP